MMAIILYLSESRFFRRDHDTFTRLEITMSKASSRQPLGNTKQK